MKYYTSPLIVVAGFLGVQPAAHAQHFRPNSVLLLERHSTLYEFEEGHLVPACPLPRTVLVQYLGPVGPHPAVPPGFCCVGTLNTRQYMLGWVDCHDVVNDEEDGRLFKELPALIKKQSPRVQGL